MPSEPKKSIEELLEASARARRVDFGGDPKMPNPMRARLQDEVAQKSRSRERRAGPPWFVLSWPRLAVGAAFASLVAATAVTWWQTHQSSETGSRFAVNQTAPAPEVSRSEPGDRPNAMAAPPAPAESEKLEAPAQNAPAERKLGDGKGSDTARLAKAAQKSHPVREDFSQSVAQPAPAKVDSLARKRDGMANFRQQFSQSGANRMTGRVVKPQEAPKILDNFQVEQNGRDFRVVDDDGSTYAGQIERLTANDTRNLLQEKRSPAVPAAKQAGGADEAPNNEFYFRASGYNASLQKSLVFEGNYILTAAPAGKDRDSAAEPGVAQLAARILGTATVPGEPPIKVDAVAVPLGPNE